MNTLELTTELIEAPTGQTIQAAAAMLRRQYEYVKTLREALQSVKRMSYDGSAQQRTCDAALAATEKING
jgi:hypothetical protein